MSHAGIRIFLRSGAQNRQRLLISLDMNQGAAQFQMAAGDVGL
jgi:hypothetical protein